MGTIASFSALPVGLCPPSGRVFQRPPVEWLGFFPSVHSSQGGDGSTRIQALIALGLRGDTYATKSPPLRRISTAHPSPRQQSATQREASFQFRLSEAKQPDAPIWSRRAFWLPKPGARQQMSAYLFWTSVPPASCSGCWMGKCLGSPVPALRRRQPKECLLTRLLFFFPPSSSPKPPWLSSFLHILHALSRSIIFITKAHMLASTRLFTASPFFFSH